MWLGWWDEKYKSPERCCGKGKEGQLKGEGRIVEKERTVGKGRTVGRGRESRLPWEEDGEACEGREMLRWNEVRLDIARRLMAGRRDESSDENERHDEDSAEVMRIAR